MLGKVLDVLTVSSPPPMSPGRTRHTAACMVPVQAGALWQWQVDKFYCHLQSVQKVCAGYHC